MTDTPARPGFARLARDSAIYAIGAVAGRAFGVLLFPILTRALSVEEFGRLDVLSALVSALVSIMLLGLDQVTVRLYVDQKTTEERERLVTTWVVMTLVAVLPVAVALALFRDSVSRALFSTDAYGVGVALVAVALVGGIANLLCLTVLRMERRPLAYALVEGTNLVLTAAATIAALELDHRSATAVLVASILGYAVSILVCPALISMVRGSVDRTIARALARAALPLVPGIAFVWIAEFANRAILVRRAGLMEAAYFSAAVRFGSLGILVATSFQLSWLNDAYAAGVDEPALRRTAHDARRIVVAVSMLAAAVGAFSRELLPLLGGRRYLPALPAVGYAELQGVALALSQVASVPSALARRFGDLGIAAAVGSVTGMLGTLALAETFGAAGAAGAVSAGVLVSAVIVAALGRRRVRAPIAWGWIAASVTSATAVVLASCVGGGAPIAIRLSLLAAAAIVFWVEGTPRTVVRWLRARRVRRADPLSD